VEFLRTEGQRLAEKLKELEARLESIRKQKAYEQGSFLMKRGRVLVEIEGLREDKFFLMKKRDKLGVKLLETHMKRLEYLEESAKEDKEESQVNDIASIDAAS
jgi:hypothetical protein